MSHPATFDHEALFAARHRLLLPRSPVFTAVFVAMILTGVMSFGLGVGLGVSRRAWGAVLLNAMYFYSLALGGVAFGHMQDLVGARWGRPIKRIHEGFGAFLGPASLVLVVFLMAVRFDLLGAGDVYSWVADPYLLKHFEGKKTWLQVDFMLGRNFLALGVIYGLVRRHLAETCARDQLYMQGQREAAQSFGTALQVRLRHWAAPTMVAYALGFSVITFDLTMSLAPTWFSTLWPGWSFSIMMHILLAALLLALFALRAGPLAPVLRTSHLHDVGKLLFGFTVFFAYLTYAHVLTYWYGNVPEETSYLITRLAPPWRGWVIASPIFSFLLPFVALIWKRHKWLPQVAIPVSGIVLLSQWLNYVWVVAPELVAAEAWNGPWLEFGVLLGFVGGFGVCVHAFLQRNPVLGVADPLL